MVTVRVSAPEIEPQEIEPQEIEPLPSFRAELAIRCETVVALESADGLVRPGRKDVVIDDLRPPPCPSPID